MRIHVGRVYPNEWNIDLLIYSRTHFQRVLGDSTPPFVYADYYWGNFLLGCFLLAQGDGMAVVDQTAQRQKQKGTKQQKERRRRQKERKRRRDKERETEGRTPTTGTPQQRGTADDRSWAEAGRASAPDEGEEEKEKAWVVQVQRSSSPLAEPELERPSQPARLQGPIDDVGAGEREEETTPSVKKRKNKVQRVNKRRGAARLYALALRIDQLQSDLATARTGAHLQRLGVVPSSSPPSDTSTSPSFHSTTTTSPTSPTTSPTPRPSRAAAAVDCTTLWVATTPSAVLTLRATTAASETRTAPATSWR